MAKYRVGKNVRGRVTIEGMDALLRRLHRLGAVVQEEQEAAMLAGAEIIRRAAAAKAPGPEIGTEIEAQPEVAGTTEAIIGPLEETWYYRFAELGATSHEIRGAPLAFALGGGEDVVTGGVTHPGMAARPFLRPAFDANRGRALEMVRKRLLRRIDEVRRA